ncbi:membrane protein [Vibrio galatheae]|uniref:Membrane protein n=1 Tax=Vibrio galatheae TaxID=579748 RepID=A0A0F4NPI7_9VIBR|nr:DMT family transporter [Vibrio galatheae]KJY85022.1 membrane protein [Vibrio galatheae]
MLKLDSMAPVLFLVMWSSGAVIVKLGLQFSSEWSFLALRAASSFIFVTVLYLVAKRFSSIVFTRLSRSDLKALLLVGLLLQILYLAFYILAIGTEMSPGLVTLILGVQPLITPLLCRQKLDLARILLLLLGFSGLTIAIAGAQNLDGIEWAGIGFAVLALFSLTWGTIKQASVKVHSIQAMWYQCLMSSLFFTALGLSSGWQVEWEQGLVFSVLWMSLVVSVGALLLLMYMVKYESSDKVSVLFYAIPILTYLFDHLLFGTTLTPVTMLGMVVVALCIVLYRRQSKSNREPDKLSVVNQNSH